MVAYDTVDAAKATMVGFARSPKATMSSSARAAWQVIAALGVGLVLKGLLGLLGVGVLQARSRRQLHPAAPIPLRPFYNQDPLQERRLRALQRRALPPTRSELILRVTWTVVFGAFSLGLGIYALDEGGGHFAPETVAGVLILLVALVSVSSSVRALQSRMRVGSSALIASSNSDA